MSVQTSLSGGLAKHSRNSEVGGMLVNNKSPSPLVVKMKVSVSVKIREDSLTIFLVMITAGKM